jgi:hypothetical protein
MDLGRNLPKPEYIHFRMTQNIEAPMGVFGAYGVFYLTYLH